MITTLGPSEVPLYIEYKIHKTPDNTNPHANAAFIEITEARLMDGGIYRDLTKDEWDQLLYDEKQRIDDEIIDYIIEGIWEGW